jgi:geranylgeranyl diphosphate synthase, type I
MTSNLEQFSNYIKEIDSQLEESFVRDNLGILIDPIDGHHKDKGKKLRGLMTLLSCEIISGDYHKAIPIAITYEMLHFASCIQDDIIDRSDLRHNKKSIPAKYSLPTSLLASDVYIFGVLGQIGSYKGTEVTKQQLIQMTNRLHNSLIATVQGEIMDVTLCKKSKVTYDEYINMIKNKTGALFSASTASGAIIGGGSNSEIEKFATFGEKQGIAFQLIDDLLDITSKLKETGKAPFTDLKNRSLNAVILHFLTNSKQASPEQEFIQSLFGKQSTETEIEKAKKILTESGSIEFVKNLSKSFALEGKNELKDQKGSIAKEKLFDLVDFLPNRDH